MSDYQFPESMWQAIEAKLKCLGESTSHAARGTVAEWEATRTPERLEQQAIQEGLKGRAVLLSAVLLLFSLPALAQPAAPAAACRVNVNTASPAQLALLINTGPALAGKIEAARTAGLLDAAKLDAVPGIGVKWLEYNGQHVAYSGETTCTEKLKKPSATGETESDTVRKEASGGGQ